MASDTHQEGPLIRIAGLHKRFGGQVALRGVDFELRAGEIHALLGENGAGKSTLIKILAGVVPRDAGEVWIGEYRLPRHPSASDVRASGLAFVHQESALIDTLSVTENIALTNGYVQRGPFISYKATARQIASKLADLQREFATARGKAPRSVAEGGTANGSGIHIRHPSS
jgi:ribose transport system ATP-binding protein